MLSSDQKAHFDTFGYSLCPSLSFTDPFKYTKISVLIGDAVVLVITWRIVRSEHCATFHQRWFTSTIHLKFEICYSISINIQRCKHGR